MKKLPLNIHSFREIREGNYLYIDKTQYIHELLESGIYYFLSRPCRFGKTLTLSTIKELFLGNKHLFEGLWIENNWDWSKKNPVIFVCFKALAETGKPLETAIVDFLHAEAQGHGFSLTKTGTMGLFKELLVKLKEKYQTSAVILIDEYDKLAEEYIRPLAVYEEERKQFKHKQEVIQNFYAILKGSDEYIRFLLITGVSKISRSGIFSGLNHLTDITRSRFSKKLMGFTEEEIRTGFDLHAELVIIRKNLDRVEMYHQLKEWYYGYSWDGKHYVYNPFSVLSFFTKGSFKNFWHAAGVPTLLVNLLKERFFYDMDEVHMSDIAFAGSEPGNWNLMSLLFQTGFLAIKEKREMGIYTLTYPNKEAKDLMLKHLIAAFRNRAVSLSTPMVVNLRKAFYKNDLPLAMGIFDTFFRTISTPEFLSRKEDYFHAVSHLVFTYLRQYMDCELIVAGKEINVILKTETHIYVLALVLDKTVKEAMTQITSKKYNVQFIMENKQVVGLGINFDSMTKSVLDWETVKLSG